MSNKIKVELSTSNHDVHLDEECSIARTELDDTKVSGADEYPVERKLILSKLGDVPPHPCKYLAPWEEIAFQWALDYSMAGMPVYPALIGKHGNKKSHKSAERSNGRKWGATLDLNEIMHDWERWPDSMVGIVTGHIASGGAGLIIVDIDTLEDHNNDGITNLTKELEKVGKSIEDLPLTATAETPTGGYHLYFRYPKCEKPLKFKKHLTPGVDIQADKQTIIAPPSYRKDKDGHYSWIRSPEDYGFAKIPEWFLTLLLDPRRTGKPSKGRKSSASTKNEPKSATGCGQIAAESKLLEIITALENAEEGERNTTLNKSAFILGQYIPGGFLEEDVVQERLMDAATGIGLEDYEAAATINSGLQAGKKEAHPEDGFSSIREIDLSHDTLARELGHYSFNSNARYVASWGKWLFWEHERWEKDDRKVHITRTRNYLKMCADDLLQSATLEAATLGDSAAASLMHWAKKEARHLRDRPTISAIATLAQSNEQSVASPQCFDKDTLLLGTPDGTVDLRTGQLRAADRDDLITKSTSVIPAAPKSEPPLWLAFLDRTFAGDKDTIAFMQRLAGYALTGLTAEHKFFFLYGGGRNGKGVFLNTLNEIWGDYTCNAPSDLFLASRFQQHPTGLAGLQGARLVIGSEIRKGATWNDAIIKDITGGDAISARYMRGDYFTFDPQLTLMIAGNEKPSLAGVDTAIRARMVLIPFNVEIPPEERDLSLKDKLMEEAPAILRWAIDGALLWQQHGLNVPESIKTASDAYLDDEDLLKKFLDDETVQATQAFTTVKDLQYRFGEWCLSEGEPIWGRKRFKKEMITHGWNETRRGPGQGFLGLQLKKPVPV